MDWKAIKKEHGVKTTEELFQIDDPPEHQCPSIDEICRAISEIDSTVGGGVYDNRDAEERISDISYEVRGLEDSVEKVRESIEHLRSWGQEWKDFAKWLIESFEISIDDIR